MGEGSDEMREKIEGPSSDSGEGPPIVRASQCETAILNCIYSLSRKSRDFIHRYVFFLLYRQSCCHGNGIKSHTNQTAL